VDTPRGQGLLMKRVIVKTFLTVAAMVVLVVPAPAFASGSQVIRDCAQDGDLDRNYSSRDLRDAESQLPTDVDEYTDCRDVINHAQVRGDRSARDGGGGGSAGGGSGGGGGSAAATPDDAKELAKATAGAKTDDAPSLSVGDERVEPSGGGLLSTAKAANDLPLPLLLVLIAVAALSAGGGYMAVRGRIPDARRFALRLLRR
jgi:hypothetical protein